MIPHEFDECVVCSAECRGGSALLFMSCLRIPPVHINLSGLPLHIHIANHQVPGAVPYPAQKNGYDCGVFTMLGAEMLATEFGEEGRLSELTQDAVSKARAGIRDVVDEVSAVLAAKKMGK